MQEQVLNKSDVESIIGNSGDSILQKVDVKARIPKFIGFFIMLLLFAGSTFSQTTLVNPSGDGGFENGTTFAANGWTDIGSVQSWFIGNATPASAGANCAYTSTTAGSWTPGTAASVGHIYRDITIPPGESILNISLKYKILATDPAWDYIRVHVVPTTTIPVAGTLLTVGQLGQTDGTTAYATYNYATSVSPGTVQRLIITFRQDGVSPYGAGALDEILVTSAAPVNYTSTAGGGLWSSPATWVGGTVPPTGNNVTIPSGSIVTVDQTINLTDLNLDGILQWNGTTPSTTVNVLNVSGNFTIGSTGRLHPYNTARVGASINVTGSFTNNGYANLSLIGGLTFNGTNCTLGGTGFFEGDGTVGQVRAITFTGNGSYSVSTTQNLVVHTTMSQTGSGTLNTNGKLSINNTVLLFGRPLNTQVANVAVTAMGTGYTTAPIVSCAGATLWTASAALAIGNIRTTATDIYLCTAAGTSGTTAPTHASGTATDGTATMLWVAPAGTIGTSFITTAPLIGTQYFYGGNLYTAVAATANTTPPTHTSGTVGSYLYAGSAARLSANWDGVSGTVRSLNIVSAGSGYSAAPTISIVANNAGSGATATAVVIQSQASAAYFPVQKSSDAVITGGLTINSDQGTSVSSTNPQASSGVGSVFCTAGGVNYTAAPTLGFSGPTALNLVTNGGSGFTTAPTITITGGTQPVGQAAYTTADFLITVNQGKVVSVYLTNTTKAYITPPTLAFTGGGGTGATLAFPANCWPAATASIGANGQITNCTVTNSGFGYVAPPTVAVGTTSGGIGAGTYTTVASGFTSRIAAYYLINNFFTPSAAASTYLDDAYIPANRKMHALFLNGNANGAKLTGNLTLISGGTGTTANINTSPSPMVLTASGSTTTTSGQNGNVLDLGGNNLVFTWNGYAGATSTFGATKAYLKNGSMTLTGRGGGLTGSTFNFPFLGAATTGGVTVFTGSGTSVANGADISTVKVTETAAPTNVTTTGTGQATGSRAYKVETTTVGAVAGTAGTNPTFKMPLATSVDNIPAAFTQPDIFVSEGTSLSGAWTIRSAAYGLTGALPANGSLTTPTTAPGPVTLASGSHYAWSTVRPTVTNVNNTTLCANSGAFTITGTNFTGITSVSIGTVAVSSYTVVNSTTIDAFAGAPTSGVVTVTNAAGGAGIGTQTITVNPSPAAPTATPASQTVLLGDVASFSATSAGGTLNWYNQPNGGTILFTGSNYTVTPCSTSTYYVAENNGTCEGGRTPLTVNVTTPSITASTATFCGTGGTTTLTANNLSTNVTTSWSSLTPSATLSTTTGNTTVATLTTTSDFQLSTTVTGCPVNNTFLSVGVYPLPNANLTATPDAICPGGSSLINTGLSSGNFSVISIPSQTFAPPANAGILMNLGVAVTPLSGGNLDDGGWGNIPIGFNFNFFGSSFNTLAAGTNGLLMFGPVPGYGTLAGQLGQYNFVGPPYFPNAANPGNIIALIATDLNMGTSVNGSIKYWTEGYAPNRKFVIQYYRVHGFSSNPEATVTCVLYETLGNVEIFIESKTFTNPSIVGLQDATKTIGAVAPGRTGTWTVTAPEGWRFSPPSNYSTVWTATNVNGSTTLATGTNIFTQTVTPTVSTNYSISYTNQTTGCSNAPGSAQVQMNVLPTTPPVGINAISSASIVCVNANINLSTSYTGTTTGLTFQWQASTDGGTTWTNIAGANTPTAATSQTVTTQYRCELTSCGGAAGYTSPVTVTLQSPPAIALSSSAANFCAPGGTPISLSVVGGGITYDWAPSTGLSAITGASVTATPATSTTYTVTATDIIGCTNTNTITVTSSPQVTFSSATATPSIICSGNNAALSVSASASGSYCQTQTNCAFPDIITNVTFGTINNTTTCGDPTTGFSFYSTPNPTITAGSSLPLSVSTGGDIEGIAVWIDYNGSGSFESNELVLDGLLGTNPATYTTTVNIPANAVNGPTRIRVRCAYNSNPSGIGPCAPVQFGETEDYLITISGGSEPISYSWTPSTYLSSTNTASTNAVAMMNSTDYIVTATSASGCLAVDTINVTVNPTPAIPVVSGDTICSGNTITLNSSTGSGTIGWYTSATGGAPFATTASYTTPVLNNSVTYFVQDSSGLGCVSQRTQVDVTVNPTPVVALGNDITQCGGTATLDAGNSGATYLWSNSINTQTATVSNSGIYNVLVTNQFNCFASDTINVTINAIPVVNLGPNASYCANSYVLDAQNAGSNYLWNNGSTSQSITVTSSGSYDVTVTTPQGCTSADTISITLSPTPIVNLGVDSTICGGGSIILDAQNAGATYLWSDNSTAPILFATTSGTYWVDVTNSSNCTTRDSIVINIVASPTVSLSGNASAVCLGDSTSLSATGANTYVWVPGSLSGSTVSVTPTSSTTYTVTGTDVNGCTDSKTISLTVNQLPNVTATSSNANVCFGNSVSLSASGAVNYQWSPINSTSANTTDNPSASITYTVTGTDSSGCSSSSQVSVQVNPNPSVSLGADVAACSGPILLDAGNTGSNYTWSDNSTSQTISVNSTGNYFVSVTDLNGCTGGDTILVTINSNPTVSLGADTTVCSGAFSLSAGNPGASYLWNDGTTNQTLQVSAGGIYFVTITYQGGCSASDTVNVGVNSLPTVTLSLSTSSVCANGAAVSLSGESPTGGSFSGLGVSGNSFDPNTVSGSIALITYDYTDANGCSASATDTINLTSLPVVTLALGVDSACSTDGVVNLTGESPLGGVFSGTSVTGSTFDPSVGFGSYQITYTYTDATTGCSNSANQNFVVDVCTGIQDGLSGINVYPNPTRGQFFLESNSLSGKVLIEIYNTQAKLVYSEQINAFYRNTINPGDLSNGIYLLRIIKGDEVKYSKITISK